MTSTGFRRMFQRLPGTSVFENGAARAEAGLEFDEAGRFRLNLFATTSGCRCKKN